ncbi:MAG: agmatine deiminase family protein, partial [Pseudomonadota bacterium]
MIRFPAEWEPQSGVFIAWPHASGDFGGALPAVEKTYVRIAREISLREPIVVACKDNAHRSHIEALLGDASSRLENLVPLQLPYNDTWVRDTAPLTVITPERAKLLDFKFNGWGGKYACQADDALARNLFKKGKFRNAQYQRLNLVLEGGSIECDGDGTLLTTSNCLLNPNRNPGMDIGELEAILKERLGVRRILWLDHGHLEGDDTDAHIDTLARFCAEDTIAYTACHGTEDPHYAQLQAMREQLREMTRENGEPYRLVELPLPAPIRSRQGTRLPANYANFLVLNEAVLVPVYDDPG